MSPQSLEQEQILTLEDRVRNRQRLKAEIKDLEEVVERENAEIKAECQRLGITDYLVDGKWRVDYNPFSTKTTLDKTALVELGVTTEQIKQATKETTFEKLDVREVKQK